MKYNTKALNYKKNVSAVIKTQQILLRETLNDVGILFCETLHQWTDSFFQLLKLLVIKILERGQVSAPHLLPYVLLQSAYFSTFSNKCYHIPTVLPVHEQYRGIRAGRCHCGLGGGL